MVLFTFHRISTIVLASSKAKHRARVIERFMLIAHQLRRVNNYDSLYAVISGLREASVHRLSASQALIQLSPVTEKDYHSHLELMNPRGGYIQYRKALQVDIDSGREAIPLLNNILGLVSRLQEVRPNDCREEDGKVQWEKFMRFGEILAMIQECQARGPAVNGQVDQGFKKVIEETTILSDEDVSSLILIFLYLPENVTHLPFRLYGQEASRWKTAGVQLGGNCLSA